MKKTQFFSREMRQGIYLISSKEWEQPTSTVNCWLVIGNEKAMLIDAGLPCRGLREYVEGLAERPVMLALSHGHFDHAGALGEFSDFWIHPVDEKLLQGVNGLPSTPYSATMHSLYEDDCVDLGGRKIRILAIEGHTKGSLVFLDETSKTLFAGDSVARRGLFIDTDELPLSKYFSKLLAIEQLDFNAVASAHDRYFLPKEEIRHFISTVISGIKDGNETWNMPNGEKFVAIHAGMGG